jgi:hypothetical protein
VTSHEICVEGSDTGAAPSFFSFPLLIIIPPLLYTHLLLLLNMCDGPDQAAHYHILSLEVGDFISGPPLAWLQSEGGSLISTLQVGFVVDKVALGQVFSECFGFPCQSSFHQLLHNHHRSSGAGTIGQQWPTYQADSVSPHPEKLVLCRTINLLHDFQNFKGQATKHCLLSLICLSVCTN